MAGSLIILHGLFLLNCSLKSQQCLLLVGQAQEHVYKVGLNLVTVDIPMSKTMKIDIAGLPNNRFLNKDKLQETTLVLNSDAVKVLQDKAVMKIMIPLPDYIYGANRLQVNRDDILNGTDSSIILNGSQHMLFAESLLLQYTGGQAFTLMDGAKPVQTSTARGSWNVMAFYSWPGQCGAGADHSHGLNDLLSVTSSGKPVNLKLIGIAKTIGLDDSGISDFGLRDSELRPPCIHSTTFSKIPKKAPYGLRFSIPGEVYMTTATETGCGSAIDLEP